MEESNYSERHMILTNPMEFPSRIILIKTRGEV